MNAQLKTRKPTKAASWPIILLAGEAKTGKTYRAAQFSGDERIGRTFWMDLGEGCADEYGAVPGADYEIVDHNGTWVDIIEQAEAVREVARAEMAAQNKPTLFVIDSMTAEWAMLTEWANTRAKRSNSNKKLLAADPDAEIDVTSNYWNDATSRHNRLMNILKTFPGIVVLTALETEKTQFGANGRPVKDAPKVAKPDGQKRLTADVSVWVRLSLDNEPTIVGIRSLKHNITPGKDRAQPWKDFSLGKLVFEFMGIGDGTQVRDTPALDADQVAPGEEVTAAEDGKPTPPKPPAQRPAINWDTELVKASGDVAALGVLHGRAEQYAPDDSGLLQRIVDAGKQARATQIQDLFNRILTVDSVTEADRLYGEVTKSRAGSFDVTDLLTQDDREALGVDESTVMRLEILASEVAARVGKHGVPVRFAGDTAQLQAVHAA